MKKSLRFASAALALTLAAGMTLPAFAAAKADYSKDETVYAVMNADGSIKSTTVSEHLYSASGLSNVTDESTLTDIQNTESDAAFTQDGEKLVWNTDDTDVYYKGNTDKALPITANVTYTLDGVTDSLENLIGKSGHLTVTVDQQRDRHRDRQRQGAHRCHPAHHCCGRDLWSGCHQPERRARNAGICRQEQRGRFRLPARREGLSGRPAAR